MRPEWLRILLNIKLPSWNNVSMNNLGVSMAKNVSYHQSTLPTRKEQALQARKAIMI
jgi:VanZ family protein